MDENLKAVETPTETEQSKAMKFEPGQDVTELFKAGKINESEIGQSSNPFRWTLPNGKDTLEMAKATIVRNQNNERFHVRVHTDKGQCLADLETFKAIQDAEEGKPVKGEFHIQTKDEIQEDLNNIIQQLNRITDRESEANKDRVKRLSERQAYALNKLANWSEKDEKTGLPVFDGIVE